MIEGCAKRYLTPTVLVFKNTMDWLTSDEDTLACAEPAGGAGK